MTPQAALLLGIALLGAPAASADEAADDEGFASIFNGKDLTGWDGDPRLWSVQDGAIVGETTAEKPARGNTFCVWRDGKLKNFALKVRFRIRNGNSGVQYRSQEAQKWRIAGYQAEVENRPGKVGFLYHERGRGWLPRVGQFMLIDADGKKQVVGLVADVNQLIKEGYYKDKDWNEYTITCRGNHVVQVLNGRQTIELIDRDEKRRCMEGVLALQIHAGPPMRVEFKDIRLKQLDAAYGEADFLFNGKDLSGWTYSEPGQKDAWSARQVPVGAVSHYPEKDLAYAVLATTGKPNGYVRTEKDYTNFVLRLQMRHLKACNTGVLLRMQGDDKVWPDCIEAQGMSGNLGDIYNIGEFPMKPDPQRTRGPRTVKIHPSNERPVGQWDNYEIELNRGDLTIRVNGLVQNRATDCKEAAGKICLQSEGGPVEFRNVVLIPILKEAPAAKEAP